MNELQLLFDEAGKLFKQSAFAASKEKLEAILVKAPSEPEVLGLLALCYTRMGDFALGEETAARGLLFNAQNTLCRDVLNLISTERDQNRRSPYFQDFMASRHRYQKYPRSVSIETTGRCNAACSFCPHPSLSRNREIMSDGLFEKIIRDLEDIPKDHPFVLVPGGVNEPFMDKKLIDRLEIINARLPQAVIRIFTNMNVMHRDFSSRIGTIQNIELINVSFNAANQQEYERVMQIDFEKTVDNLRTLMALNRSKRITKVPIVLSRVADHTLADQEYLPQVKNLFPEFKEGIDYLVKVKNRTNWINHVDLDASPVPKALPCGAWFDINIYCNGTVPHCCQDSDGTYSIGDASISHVLEVYNGQEFRYLRDHIVSRQAAGYPCNQCSLLQ